MISVSSGGHVDGTAAEEADRPFELAVEAEGAAELDLLGDDGVDRERHVAAEADLDDDGAGSGDTDGGGQGGGAAGGFENDVEIAFAGGEAVEAGGIGADVDGGVGADLLGDGERRVGEVGGDDLAGAGLAGDQDREGRRSGRRR